MVALAIIASALLAAWIYWPLYRSNEICRLTDATMARYARRWGK